MKTVLLDAVRDRENAVKKAAEILKSGGIVAIPTETVYGLAANAFDSEAVKKIFVAKGRPQDNPLIVHVCDEKMLDGIAEDIPDLALRLAERFWAGPLTLILKRAQKIPACVSAGLDTVAVRCPDNDIARDIIKTANLPLAAPSANLSGKPSPTTAQHVINDLDGLVDAIVIGEDCKIGVESTVLSLCTTPPRLLRPGAVTVENLSRFIPDIEVDRAVLSEPKAGEKVASPGMKYKHYAPKTDTFLVEGGADDFAAFVNEKTGAVAVCFDDEAEKITVRKITYGNKGDAKTLARELFAVLRKTDDLSADAVYVHAPDKSGVGLAVYNRLIRAAAFRVIKL